MKRLNFHSSQVFLENHPALTCGNNEIILKLNACGICGSDLANIFSKSCKPTQKIGHEVSGIIKNKGSEIKKFNVGDRIIVNHHCQCDACYFCNKGNQTMCEKFVDMMCPCGMSEEILIPEWIIHKEGIFVIPDSIRMEESVLIEPLACCIRAWKNIPISKIRSVIIFGLGPIGFLHALLAKYFGISDIFGFDISMHRTNYCNELGVIKPIKNSNISDVNYKDSINSAKVDLAIIANSDMSSLLDAVNLIDKGGIILLFGEPKLNDEVNIDFSKIYHDEVSIISSYAATNEEFKIAMNLVKEKRINLENIITHKFPLEQIDNAFSFAKEKKAMKVIVIN